MRTVTVKTGRPYEVLIGAGLLSDIGKRVAAVTTVGRAMLVSDDNVYAIYGEKVGKALEESGFQISRFVIRNGEESKNLQIYGQILESLCENRFTRDDVIIALGGGVTGDLAGFVAATYQRGIPFVQVPTSLLAAVDSSVGGKTAVDLPNGKNQVGCFYQPVLVLCDTDTLQTLPKEEYRNGCAEIIKYGMLDGPELFGKLESKPVSEQYEDIIERCVSIKRDYVEQDEYDRGMRMLLNLGHTIGHAVETCSEFRVPHGNGVAIGMAKIAAAAARKGFCGEDTAKRLTALIRVYGLPTKTSFAKDDLWAAAMNDKKNATDAMRIVVPEAIGRCSVIRLSREEFREWL